MKKPLAQVLVLALAIPAWTGGCYKRVEIPSERLRTMSMFPDKEGPYFVQTKTRTKSPALKNLQVTDGRLRGEFKDPFQKGQTTYQLTDVARVERTTFSASRTTLAIIASFIAACGLGFGFYAVTALGEGK
jgi:hypothetical protein